ncbi:MAG TPA: hypothetical protein VGJ31_17130, partial [Dongiaceae bacterium]
MAEGESAHAIMFSNSEQGVSLFSPGPTRKLTYKSIHGRTSIGLVPVMRHSGKAKSVLFPSFAHAAGEIDLGHRL